MNYRSLAIVASGLCLGACAPQVSDGNAFHMMRDVPPCLEKNEVTINIRSINPKAVPEHVCVKAGTTLTMKISPAPAANTVIVIAKTYNPDGGGWDNWLTKVNDGADPAELTINVRDSNYMVNNCGQADYDDDKCYFDYAIYVTGKNPVDPRVTVKK